MRAEEQKLALIRWLFYQPIYTGNDELAAIYLKLVGLVISRDDLRERFGELERAGLVKTAFEGALMVITLSGRGGEVAQGVVEVEGVRRPGPQCPY